MGFMTVASELAVEKQDKHPGWIYLGYQMGSCDCRKTFVAGIRNSVWFSTTWLNPWKMFPKIAPYIIFLLYHGCDWPTCFIPRLLVCSHGYQTLVLQIVCNLDIRLWHSLRICMLVILLSAVPLYSYMYKCWLNKTLM